MNSCLRVNLTTLKEVSKEGRLSDLCRPQLVIWKEKRYREWVFCGFQTFCRDNRYFKCYPNQSEENMFFFLETTNWTNQEQKKDNQSCLGTLTYVFPCLAPVTGLSSLDVVCFHALCIGGFYCFPALSTISLFPPKRRYRFEFRLKHCVIFVSC